jgi:predicted dehydrogenase
MDSYEAEWRHFHDVVKGRAELGYTVAQAERDLDLALRICGN